MTLDLIVNERVHTVDFSGPFVIVDGLLYKPEVDSLNDAIAFAFRVICNNPKHTTGAK